ncbi:stage III sporulation protein SpoAB [Clostridium tertium]|uniref:Stage III sporulation protein SpoAB n=1 Tax=Clostridium tertium TaxID=1559 RepID=A0A6N3GDT5_9CLOT
MLKIIAVIIIFFCSSFIGYYYGETFKKRSKQLKEILKALLFLNNEVIYANTPLPEALSYISQKVEDPIKLTLNNVSSRLNNNEVESVYSAFENEYRNNRQQYFLKDEDKAIIKDFFKGLGETGVYGQDKIFNLTIENLKINCNIAEELSKKNSKMYRVIGMCVGAMISIFFI